MKILSIVNSVSARVTSTPIVAAGGFDFGQVMGLVSKAVLAGGAIWLGVGVVILALGLKNKEAPQIQSGIWQVVGGALITAAGGFFSSISF